MLKNFLIVVKNFIFGRDLDIKKGDLVELSPNSNVVRVNDYSRSTFICCAKYIDFSKGEDVKDEEVVFYLNRWGEIEERSNSGVGEQQFLSYGKVLATMGWMIWGVNDDGEECFLNNYYGRLNTKIGLVLSSYKTFWRIERVKYQEDGYNWEGGPSHKWILHSPINWYCVLIGDNHKIWINDKMYDFKKL